MRAGVGKRRIKLRELRKIMGHFGVSEDTSRGKGGHTLFYKKLDDGTFSYPVPTENNVLPCYVKACRKKFRLTIEHGVSDEEFFAPID